MNRIGTKRPHPNPKRQRGAVHPSQERGHRSEPRISVRAEHRSTPSSVRNAIPPRREPARIVNCRLTLELLNPSTPEASPGLS